MLIICCKSIITSQAVTGAVLEKQICYKFAINNNNLAALWLFVSRKSKNK